MEKVTDWIKLWKELVEQPGSFRSFKKRSEKSGNIKEERGKGKQKDKWKDRAKGFDEKVKERWSKPDPHIDFIISRIESVKYATVLDIGAGTGAWAVTLSKYARKITAVEPSASMRKVFKDNLEKESITNVEVLEESWPDIKVGPHDFVLSSHSVYGYADLPGFVGAMTTAARRACFMLLRAPDSGGLMARAAELIWGQPNDSPNFQVAYNVLLQMGLFPDVLMADKDLWPGWSNKSYDEALERIKSRFDLAEGSQYENQLRALLKEHLREKNGRVEWPSEVRTALLYWNTSNEVA